MLEGFLIDLRRSLRTLAHRPMALAVAIAAMAVGIGAAVAIFGVVNAVLLRPLPYPQAERLVAVWGQFTHLDLPQMALSEPEVVDFRQRCHCLDQLAAISVQPASLTGGEAPERVRMAAVSPALFAMLGVPPARGRVFIAGEDRQRAQRVAVLSDAFWRQRKGADPGVLGSGLTVDGNHYTVIGVMPPSFRYPERVDFWIPFKPSADPGVADRGNHYLRAVGRLRSGVPLERAQTEIRSVALQLQHENPTKYQADSGWGALLVPLQRQLTGDVRPALVLVLVAVGLVLLIACANVANLQLERALYRSRETTVRAALGEGRARLTGRAVAESLLITGLGGGVGVLLAALGVRSLSRMDPRLLPRAYDIALDGRVLSFALLLVVVTGVAIGLFPAVQGSRCDLAGALKEGGEKAAGSSRARRVRRLLAIVETAMALVMVLLAGLLARAYANLERADPGIATDHALSLQVALPVKRYKSAQQLASFYQKFANGAATLPGVTRAGMVDCLPLSGCESTGSYFAEGHPLTATAVPPEADMRIVTWDYLAAIGVRNPLRGRLFNAHDTATSPPVVIIDEELARRAWPGENPIGKNLDFNQNGHRTVVGVVRHVKDTSSESQPREQMYVPFEQCPFTGNEAFLVLRSAADPASLIGPVRRLARTLDPELPLFDVLTLAERRALDVAPQHFSTTLVLALALLALFLAEVGMYSVIAYSASQRDREIGVRMALGAQRRDILFLVVGEGFGMAFIGIFAGLALAYPATRLLSGLLFGLTATDFVTYCGASLVLLATAIAASYLPARAAARSSPAAALTGR